MNNSNKNHHDEHDFPWRPGLEPAGQVVLLNEWIKTYARENEHFYVDFFSSMADKKME